jgi:hypothetical protein
VSQVFHFVGTKGTFGIFDKQLVVLQQMKDFLHMDKMGIPSVIVNEDVIKENQDKLLKVMFQEFIHETFEGGWGIEKAKRHDQEFIMAFMSSKHYLRNICLLHSDMVIAKAKV